MSGRHHNETWVKGGYIQFDKCPFKGEFWQKLMEVTTIKVGHMEINYVVPLEAILSNAKVVTKELTIYCRSLQKAVCKSNKNFKS